MKMGREIDIFFKFDINSRKSICNVCGVKLSGSHITNLRRHLNARHKDIFETLKNQNFSIENENKVKKRKISFETNVESIIASLIKIVTTDGRPFLLLDGEGFREILNPIYNALQMVPITSRNIMEHVRIKEIAIRDDIKASVQRKLISLKIDVATRMEKSILGINLQMMKTTYTNTEIVVKTLGMVQLFESHTGLYIKNKILDILHDYDIEVEQIFSITSDNGRNMIKAIELINDDGTPDIFNDDEKVNEVMGMLDTITLNNVHLVRCAAHTLQLCVNDVNKIDEINQKVHTCRQICKTFRSGKYRRYLMEQKKTIPTLDVTTRWNSTYLMLVKLLDLKSFITTESSFFIEVDWEWIELYINAFKDAYDTTLKLQQEQLLYSDFFIAWVELRLKCENSQNKITKQFLTQVQLREKNLLENKALLSAIYLDPRINLFLTEEQKILAKQNLKTIASRYFSLNQINNTANVEEDVISVVPSLSSSLNDSQGTSLFSTLLDGIQAVQEVTGEEVSCKLSKLYMEIDNFNLVYGRLPLSANIKDFYREIQLKSPHLIEVAMVVLATPATQVSVERSFSALNFILNERRTSLSAENINSLLIVKLNS